MDIFIKNFVLFFAMIDPLGSVGVFLSLTASYTEEMKRKIAFKAVAIATGILLFFVILGEIILKQFQIPIPAFQIAGGIIIFLFAVQMIMGESKQPSASESQPHGTEIAVFPLAIPSIASPGALLSCVLLTENDSFDVWEQAVTSLAMLSVLIILLIMLLSSKYISRAIGASGADVIARVMGLLLASIAVAAITDGLKATFPQLLS